MSKGKSKAGGTYNTTSVTVQNGRTLTLSSSLSYDGDDNALGRQARSVVDAFEQAHKQAAVESCLFTKADGTQVYANTGRKGSVSHPAYIEGQAEIMTHNHPRPGKYENQMGGTFSVDDIKVLSRPYSTVTTIRASAAEGTYSMSIPKNANRTTVRQMVSAYGRYIKQQNAKYAAVDQAKYNDYLNGKCKYSEYRSVCNHSMNDFLLDLHNWLRKNSKQYGCSYTLEK